jgi:hypothetical protein
MKIVTRSNKSHWYELLFQLYLAIAKVNEQCLYWVIIPITRTEILPVSKFDNLHETFIHMI